ncbi:reverse transcriptase domain-containing protein [Tanacetum coccineum]
MDKKISTFADRQAENKRKLDNNNQAQQKLPKRQNVAHAYAAGTGERKEYAGTLPLCNKCKFHHNGQCTVKNLTCYECGNQGHYKSDCAELKNRNHGNQARGTELGTVHALVGGETNQDPDDMKDDINA